MDTLNINYQLGNIDINLSTDVSNDNAPYNLADLFIKIIEDTNVNESMVIEGLIDHFGYDRNNEEQRN